MINVIAIQCLVDRMVRLCWGWQDEGKYVTNNYFMWSTNYQLPDGLF